MGVDAVAVEATYQVDIYGARAAGPAAFDVVAQAARGVLQRHRGGVVQDTFIDAERNDYEDDTELFRKSFDIRMWYTET